MSVGEEYTNDQLYDMIQHPDKLKSYPGFQRALAMGVADHMDFYYDLPYDEIKQVITRINVQRVNYSIYYFHYGHYLDYYECN